STRKSEKSRSWLAWVRLMNSSGATPAFSAASMIGVPWVSLAQTKCTVPPAIRRSCSPPRRRASEHFFFRVGDFTATLRDWLQGEVAIPGVKAKLREWIDAEGGLRDWDISRD